MLCKSLHRCAPYLLRQPLLLCLRPIIQKLFLILKLDCILPNQCSGVSGPLILQKAAGTSPASPILMHHILLLRDHLAFSLDFDDAALIVVAGDIGASHLGHPAEDVVECASCRWCILQHHFEL